MPKGPGKTPHVLDFLGAMVPKTEGKFRQRLGIQVSSEHHGTLRKIICLKTKEFWIQIRKAPFSYDTMELRKKIWHLPERKRNAGFEKKD